jgi:hypothetical protein
MKEPTIRFPVTCPRCGSESLTELPIADVANALLVRGHILQLFVSCHEYSWAASQLELQQIREYLGAPWLDAQRP